MITLISLQILCAQLHLDMVSAMFVARFITDYCLNCDCAALFPVPQLQLNAVTIFGY
uniref:Uncharacterized protein n=1 Tax=Chenopodium quinoa TaxID=63459 RepID=A0A803M8P9_CHEQI